MSTAKKKKKKEECGARACVGVRPLLALDAAAPPVVQWLVVLTFLSFLWSLCFLWRWMFWIGASRFFYLLQHKSSDIHTIKRYVLVDRSAAAKSAPATFPSPQRYF